LGRFVQVELDKKRRAVAQSTDVIDFAFMPFDNLFGDVHPQARAALAPLIGIINLRELSKQLVLGVFRDTDAAVFDANANFLAEHLGKDAHRTPVIRKLQTV